MLIIILLLQCIFAADSKIQLREEWREEARKPLMSVVRAVIKEIAERRQCVVFIVDSYYRRKLEVVLVKIPKFLPKYVIVVRKNEGFFPPKDRFHTALAASKETGCNAYVILNRNGLQVSRLLQYGEKERLLDTRGDFLLLHDIRLFQPRMNYIWNRIVNVIFIRRFKAVKRRTGEEILPEWFDLSTVTFPARNKGADLVPRQVNTWYRGRFYRDGGVFDEKTTDLGRQSLRVAVFEHIPAVAKNAKSHYEAGDEDVPLGIEFELMLILARGMNFKPSVYLPPNSETERWGSPGENGSYSGLLGEAVAGRASLLLGDFHYTAHHLGLMDLSAPYNTECLTFLTPESLTDNTWKILIMPFKKYMWAAVLSTLFMGGFIFHLFARFYEQAISSYKSKQTSPAVEMVKIPPTNDKPKKPTKRERNIRGLYIFTELQNSILYTYGMLLNVSLPRLPDAWALQVLIGWWWLYSILVAVAYRASMTASLANPTARVTIDTVDQLARSPKAVGGWGEDKKKFFLSSLDEDSQKIGSKFELVEDEEDAVARVAAGSFAYYENEFVLREARATRQILEDELTRNASKNDLTIEADRKLHIMRECVINMPISLGLDKNSPLKPRVDALVRRATEVGLVQKWLSDVMQWTVNVERPRDTDSQKALIDLHKLYGALMALAIGYFVSFAALLGELLHWKYIVQKDPIYDKYHLDAFYQKTAKTKGRRFVDRFLGKNSQ